jgi:hypothetical protein
MVTVSATLAVVVKWYEVPSLSSATARSFAPSIADVVDGATDVATEVTGGATALVGLTTGVADGTTLGATVAGADAVDDEQLMSASADAANPAPMRSRVRSIR